MKKVMTGINPRGIIRLCMALGLSLLFPLLASSDDSDNLLANGDFSKGADGWGGDAGNDSSATDISAPLSNPGSSGVTVHLHSNLVTRIYQSFESRNPYLSFTITCTLSSDCKFTGEGKVAKVATDMHPEIQSQTYTVGNLTQKVTNPNYDVYISGFYGPTLIVEDRDNDQVFAYPLQIDSSSITQQTVTVGFGVQTHKDYKIFIAFPPGEGSISLKSVSLTKVASPPSQAPAPSHYPAPSRNPAAPSNDNPFQR